MVRDGLPAMLAAPRMGWPDGFVTAAVLAPPISLAISVMGLLVAALGTGGLPDSLWDAIGPFLFLLIMVSLMGAIPSLIFGGVVLAAIKALRLPRSRLVFTLGGALAAGLYVAFGLGLSVVSPTAALMVAPWATLLADRPRTLEAFLVQGDVWVPISILLSGMAAGLIYARSSQRG